jgi:hypothetical protein
VQYGGGGPRATLLPWLVEAPNWWRPLCSGTHPDHAEMWACIFYSLRGKLPVECDLQHRCLILSANRLNSESYLVNYACTTRNAL